VTRYAQRTLIQQGSVANWGKAASSIGVKDGYGVATGGTSYSVTVNSIVYTLLSFTSDSNLVVSSSGLFDILLIGGGGGAGGGDGSPRCGGGGGGGDVVGLDVGVTQYLAAGTYSVDIGAGGTGAAFGAPTSGAKTTLAGLIAIGGGAGASVSHTVDLDYANLRSARNGGSGGGSTQAFGQGCIAIGIKGNDGGTNGVYGGTASSCGGGGGGAGSAGGSVVGGTTGGAGGNGADIYPFVNSVSVLTNPYYASAGGGGGGSGTGGAAGNGGVAGKNGGTGNAGVNYGAGAGGTNNATGGAGAAGLVLVRFKV